MTYVYMGIASVLIVALLVVIGGWIWDTSNTNKSPE